MSQNLLCVGCQQPLRQTGTLLDTFIGHVVCCQECRRLYQVELIHGTQRPTMLIKPINDLNADEQAQVIASTRGSRPLKEFVAPYENLTPPPPPPVEERNVNPHFAARELRAKIYESRTPTELIEKLNDHSKDA